MELTGAYFYRDGVGGMSTVVGVESKVSRVVRYVCKSPASGASSVTFHFIGSSAGDGDQPPKLRCYIGESPDSHVKADINSPYTCDLTYSGGNYEGTGAVTLKPSTTYYVWVFPALNPSSSFSWVYWRNTDQSADVSGAAKSTIVAYNGTLGQANTIKINRLSTAATHKLIGRCGSSTVTIAAGVQADSYNWAPPIDWAREDPFGQAVSADIICETYIGETIVGTDVKTASFAIPAYVIPTVSITLSDPTGFLQQYGIYIQSKSQLKVSLAVEGSYASTITRSIITCGGLTASGPVASFALPNAGAQTVTAQVWDTRGRTTATSLSIAVRAYNLPTANVITFLRCNKNGSLNQDGDHAKAVFNGSADPLDTSGIRYDLIYREGSASSWTTKHVIAYDGNPSVQNGTTIIPASPATSVSARLRVTDHFGGIAESLTYSIQGTFRLVDIDHKSKAIGFGKVASVPGQIESGLPLNMNGFPILNYPWPLAKGTYSGNISVVSPGTENALENNGMYWVGPGFGTQDLPKAEFGQMFILTNSGNYTEIILFISGDVYFRMAFNGGDGFRWHEWHSFKGTVS